MNRLEEAITVLKKITSHRAKRNLNKITEIQQKALMQLISVYYLKNHSRKKNPDINYLVNIFKNKYPESKYLVLILKWYNST